MLLAKLGPILLSSILAFQMLVAPVAHAIGPVQSEEASPYSVQLSFNLPNEGQLDSFHQSSFAKNANVQVQMEYSLYALRNLMVMKLLKTRLALKEIIGDEKRLNGVSKFHEIDDDGLSYVVPASLKKLYMGQKQILEIAEDVNLIEDSSPRDSAELRKHTIMGLVALSMQLVRFDNLIKYVTQDMWEQAFDNETARRVLKPSYSKKYNVKQTLAELYGHRDAILYKYHLLNHEVKKEPLYKRIYKVLEEKYDFPKSSTKQSIKGQIFKSRHTSIELPTEFEEALNLRQDEVYEDEKLLEKIYEDSTPAIEKTLLISLQNNYEALKDLTEPVHFSDDEDMFLFLSKDEASWSETKRIYSYLQTNIKFDEGFVHSYSLNYDIQLRKNTLKTIAIQTGIALALVSAALSGGATLAAGGAAVTTGTAAASMAAAASITGFASSAIMLGQAAYSYQEARTYSEYATHLFLGSKDLSSMEEAKHWSKVERSEFSSMIFSLVLIGAPTAVLRAISQGRKLVAIGGKVFVQIHPDEIKKLKDVMGKFASRFEKMGRLGQGLLRANLNTLAKATGTTDRLIKLEKIIESSAKAAGMSVARAKEIIRSHPRTQQLIDWYVGRTQANPLFVSQLVREVGMDFIMHVSSEYVVRGDMFWDEIDYVLINSLVGIGVATTLMIKATPSKDKPKLMFDVLLDKRGGFFASGLAPAQRAEVLKESFKLFYKPGLELTAISSGLSFVVSGGVETYKHFQDPKQEEAFERFKRVLATSLYYGVFVGVVSNLKGQSVNGWIEPRIANKLGQRALARKGIMDPTFEQSLHAAQTSPLQQGIMGSFSVADNFIENFLFSWGIRTLKIQNNDELSHVYKEELAGVYLRVQDKTEHSKYLFDFL